VTVTLERTLWPCGDVTLVAGVLENEGARTRRVRVANALDGSVLPPRTAGVIADGWEDGGVECLVGPGERVPFGYACRATASDPACRIVRDESTDRVDGPTSTPRTAADAVRDLPDPRPPSAGVPIRAGSDSDPAPAADPASVTGRAVETRPTVTREATGDGSVRDRGGRPIPADLPPAVAAWLDEVAARIDAGRATSGDRRGLVAVGERVREIRPGDR